MVNGLCRYPIRQPLIFGDNMIISFTGHRAGPKMGGFKIPNPVYNYVCQETEKLLCELEHIDNDIVCRSGMSTGYDMWAAFICIELGLPFVATVPFVGQEKIWPKESQDIYYKLLHKACRVEIVSEGGYSPEKMQIRNERLVDKCDVLIAAFDGSNGGTKNCVEYAKSKNKEIHIINPNIERQ